MKSKTLVRSLLLTGVLIFFSGAAVASAQGGGVGGGGFGFIPALIRHAVSSALDLTSEQQTQIDAVIAVYRPKLKEQLILAGAARKTLLTAIHAEQFNEAEVRSASRALASHKEELDVIRAQMAQQIRPLLTPEQRNKAKRFLENLPKPVDFVKEGESA